MTEQDEAPPVAGFVELDRKLDMLIELFRRRLSDDRAKAKALELLEREGVRARMSEIRSAMQPVVSSVALVIDRLDRYEGADPEFAASIRDELLDLLWRVGFRSRDEVGGRFDPALDHAVGVVRSGEPAGTVVEVVRRGFAQEGWVLRPAQVVLSEP